MENHNKTKKQIEAIYPLSSLQQSILFHHLTEEDDKGFLIVQSDIAGPLNIEILKNSWAKTIERHAVLRTTVHWDKIKSPVQVVNQNDQVHIAFLDLSHKNQQEQDNDIIELKSSLRTKGINFQESPLSNVTLVKKTNDSYVLLWVCHHLLLDGWSSSILIQDIFKYYQALETDGQINLPSLPSHKSYLNYIKQISIEDAKSFWTETFENHHNKSPINTSKTVLDISEEHLDLSQNVKDKINALTKTYRITSNTLFQGIWALVLSKLLHTDDVVYGNTVSGRSLEFPNIELMAGMFANVVPLRAKLTGDLSIDEILTTIQKQQTKARNFEHISTDQIVDWINVENSNLFDSLFIFENFPWKNIKTDSLLINNSESGITTTYPLTLVVNSKEKITISLMYDTSIFSKTIANWILSRFEEVIESLFNKTDQKVEVLLSAMTKIEFKSKSDNATNSNRLERKITRPKNNTELELLQIWQITLGIQKISTTDNFFELGGKSIMAVKMISVINKKLNTKLSVTTLLEFPTIIKLSNYIGQDSKPEPLNHIVPIRSKGDKNPLFCIHAGGGHVFFYGLLKDHLKEGRPIYALEPAGLQPNEEIHESIEVMAKDYLKVIRKIQPNGPYNILVYCFSTTVGYEMTILLENENEKVNFIIVDSMATNWGGAGSITILTRIDYFLKRFFKSPIQSIKNFLRERYYIIELVMLKIFGSDAQKRLIKVQKNLRRLSETYKFTPKEGTVTLILTDKGDKRFENNHIESWKKIINGDVNILFTQGHHNTLFEKPDIEFVSEKIDMTFND